MREITKLEDLTPDQRNANKGTKRGLDMLETSLRKHGAGRSILADREGNVIAGNKTLERAVELGLRVKVVETDGSELVVVQRRDVDLNSPKGRELAVADNRVAEVDLEWDAEAIAGMISEGVDLDSYFFKDELVDLLKEDDEDKTAPKEKGSKALGPTVETTDANVKLVQLYLTPNQRERFLTALNKCVVIFSTDNPSDTCLMALEKCASQG